jgi:hypothetical protein
MINNISKKLPLFNTSIAYSFSSGTSFLKMVESFFDRAAVHTFIRTDRLNFYKKAENVVKCNIPLVRGTISFIKITAQFKLFLLTDVNIRLINYRQKEERDMPKMSILNKYKL